MPTNSIEQNGTFFSRVDRNHIIGAVLVILGLLSIIFLTVAVVQGKDRENNNDFNNNPSTATSRPPPPTTTDNPTTTNNNNSESDQYCLSQGCLAGATHQMRFMNRTLFSDRCTDFYKYACGNWRQARPIQSYDPERTVLDDIITRRDGEIKRLLDSPVSRVSVSSWEWKIKVRILKVSFTTNIIKT